MILEKGVIMENRVTVTLEKINITYMLPLSWKLTLFLYKTVVSK